MASLLSGGEVLNVHVGAAGANLAAAFWQLIAKEHHLVTSLHVQYAQNKLKQKHTTSHQFDSSSQARPLQSQNLSVFFDETYHRYVPRAVFVDVDPAAKYSGIFEPYSPLKHFFRPENFCFGKSGSSGIRASAVSCGFEDSLRTMEVFVGELEKCNAPQGVQITHHLGGGCGSGIGCLMASHIRDEFGSKFPICPVTFIPSSSDVGRRTHSIEVYNSVLSLPDLAELSDLVLMADNEALNDICMRLVGMPETGWRDLNHVLASVLAGFFSCMRFPGSPQRQPASELQFRELPILLTPQEISGLPFVVPGFTPLTNRASNAPLGGLLQTFDTVDNSSSELEFKHRSKKHLKEHEGLKTEVLKEVSYNKCGTRMPSLHELCRTLYRPDNLLVTVDPVGHHYSKAACVFRGQINPDSIKQELNYLLANKQQNKREWSNWMPDDIQCRVCQESDTSLQMSSSWAGSSTCISPMLIKLLDTFKHQLEKKAFVHSFASSGMDEVEFYHKAELLQAIIDKYDEIFSSQSTLMKNRMIDRQHLGEIPMNADLDAPPYAIFDNRKPVKFRF